MYDNNNNAIPNANVAGPLGVGSMSQTALPSTSASPREAWQTLQAALGEGTSVHDAVVDAEGIAQTQTGELAVEFAKRPSDAELSAFAERNGLRLLRRNAYVPEKAIFAPLDPARQYVPDLVARLKTLEGVSAAYPGTMSRYKKL
jgi:hypothetical protein